jgi:hypothetical protein
MPAITKLPWISLSLLLVSYASLGWTVSGAEFPDFFWVEVICEQVYAGLTLLPTLAVDGSSPCHIIAEHNLAGALLAVSWILLAAIAFMSPLTSFSRFITQSFKSDTVAFLSVFLIAGLATIILFWMHVFMQILTILAAEALARLDIQTRGLSGVEAFWILVLVSLTGLSLGWTARIFM